VRGVKAVSFNLADYGYDTMRPYGWQARGERPLLVILCTLSGPLGPPVVDPYQLFGKADDLTWRNVRDYFLAVSCGRFTWKPAHTSIFSVALDKMESQTTFVERLPILYRAVKSQNRDFFKAFDSNHDGELRYGELSILVIDNGDSGFNQTNLDGPAIRVADQTTSADNSVGHSFVGTPNSLCLIAHELSHILGTDDLYGPDNDLNGGASLMGEVQDGDGYASYHLDPWHKMRLGWAEPRIHELNSRQPIFLHAAGQGRPDGAVILFDRAKDPQEYFMLEFRNSHRDVAEKYDRNAFDTGLVIWQVKTDPVFELIKVPVPPPQWDHISPVPDYKCVSYLGKPPANHQPLPGEVDPNFARGKGQFWHSGEVTPQLTWFNGRPTGTRISVRSFAPEAKGIFVDLIDDRCQLPRSAEFVSAGRDRMSFVSIDQALQLTAAIFDPQLGSGGFWRGIKVVTEPGAAALKQSQAVLLGLQDASREAYWIRNDDSAILVSSCVPDEHDMGDWTQPQIVAPAGSAKANTHIAAVARNPDHRDVFWVHEDGSLRSAWRDTYFNSGAWNQFVLVGSDKSWRPAGPASLTAIAPHPEMVAVYWGASDGSIRYATWGAGSGWSVERPALMAAGSLKSGSRIVALSRSWHQVDLFWLAPDNSLCTLTIPVVHLPATDNAAGGFQFGGVQLPANDGGNAVQFGGVQVPANDGGNANFGGLSSPRTLAPGTRVHSAGEFDATAPDKDRIVVVWRNPANVIEEVVFDDWPGMSRWTAPAGVPPSISLVGRLIGITSRTAGDTDLVWIGPKHQVWSAHRANGLALDVAWAAPPHTVFGASPAW
jgi:M6 family metalloprotease-like protein